ncbi:MAG: polysaccharide lyase family 7 protein [Spirochaetales bacterium]|nr:polysaccharide lyase family 7 protein [Spirochaetales bacterium]
MEKTILALLLLLSLLGCSSTSSETEVGDDGDYNTSITWENWYLSVPVDDGDGATSLYYEDIESDNLSDDESEYFYPNYDEDSSYTLYTNYTGYTTSGYYDYGTSGKYCRTELREFWEGNQDTDDNWSMDGDIHQMESTLQVEYCSDEAKGTYVAQIHGVTDSDVTNSSRSGSPATVKVLYEPDGNLKLEYYTAPTTDPDTTEWSSTYVEKIDLGYVDNYLFTIKLKVEDGVLYYGLTCGANYIDIDYTEVYDYASNSYDYSNYFKTGNYFGYNEDSNEYAQVILYGVETYHGE